MELDPFAQIASVGLTAMLPADLSSADVIPDGVSSRVGGLERHSPMNQACKRFFQPPSRIGEQSGS